MPAPADFATHDGQACLFHCRRQLERQRNLVQSWPLGIALAAPAYLLCCLGPRHLPWTVAVGMIGIGAFAAVVALIHDKLLAGRWQQELDSLLRMETTETP